MARFIRSFTVVLGALAIGAYGVWAAEAKPKGEEIFVKSRCPSCHTVKAVGIEKKAAAAEEESATPADTTTKPPDLSGVGTKHSQEWMTKWLLREEKMHDKLHRKKFRGTETDLKALTAWLSTLKTDEAGKPLKKEEAK